MHYVAEFGSIHLRNIHNFTYLVISLLRHLLFVDHYGIVKVSAFDQAGRKQRFYLTYKYESAAGSNLGGESLISSSDAYWLSSIFESYEISTLTLNVSSGRRMMDEPVDSSRTSILDLTI